MSTRRLYYDDSFQDNFKAQVLSCEPLSEPFDGGYRPCWAAVLDQTQFYPTSGGQPHDLGKLGEANVNDVRDSEDRIIHIIDRPIPLGHTDGCIHWPRRFDHMQQHTGQHLLSAVFQERFGLVTVSFHLGEHVCSIDLQGPQPSPLVLEGAARAANEAIFDDREITVRYGTAEEFASQGARKQVDRRGVLRAIEIAGIDLQPCGGTHLRRTGQLGLILILGVSKIRQDWRVEFLCGGRAEAAARRDAATLAALAAELRCAPGEVAEAVERLQKENAASSRRLKALLPRVADADAAGLLTAAAARPDGLRVVARLLENTEAEELQFLATSIARSEQAVALLAHPETGALVFAQHPGAARDMNALLKKVFVQFPGKGGGSKDFVRGALSTPGDAAAALHFAASSV